MGDHSDIDHTGLTGVGGGGISAGTSFPGSPSTDDLFHRTDRDRIYFYDGTRWLTIQQFRDTGTPSVAGNSADQAWIGQWPVPLTATDIWVVEFITTAFVITTNSGSHYWTFQGCYVNSATAETNLIGTAPNSSAETHTTWFRKVQTVGEVLSTNARLIRVKGVKTGSPGNLWAQSSIVYRMIG